MKEIIAFVREVDDEQEKTSVREMHREEFSSVYFHSIFNSLRGKGFHGGELVFLEDDNSPVEKSRIRVNHNGKLIDNNTTEWES